MLIQDYLMLNLAVAVGYIITRVALIFPSMLYSQKLKFSRISFVGITSLFFIMPLVHFSPHVNFQLGPMIKMASDGLISNHKIIAEKITHISVSQPIWPINSIIIILVLMGMAVFLGKYIKNIRYLYAIQKQAFCKHRINNTAILFYEHINMPFCWSILNKNYIAMPNGYLEKYADLKLALRHELQHIRQHDTHWLHFLLLIKAVCFLNPFIYFWIKWLDLLQEFSCDEAIVLRQKTSPVAYAQCLLNAVSGVMPQGALGIRGLSQSVLYRRVHMIFNFKESKAKVFKLIGLYVASALIASTAAYAINGHSSTMPLSTEQVENSIKNSNFDPSFQISATPEVVKEINNIRSSGDAKEYMNNALSRMKKYDKYIQSELNKKNMPHELLAIPLVESGYQPLDQGKNPVQAAGIWQFIPQTAKNYGLVINNKRDDRMDTALSTKAALNYLTDIHNQFNNWALAVISYEIGEERVARLVEETGSQNVWKIAQSPNAPKSLKQFIATFDASLIIMKNPSLLNH